MSGEFAWTNMHAYCYWAVQEVASQMRDEASEATSVVIADFLEHVGSDLVHQVAYSEAGDASITEADAIAAVDKLIDELQAIKARLPELIKQGNRVELVVPPSSKDDDNDE